MLAVSAVLVVMLVAAGTVMAVASMLFAGLGVVVVVGVNDTVPGGRNQRHRCPHVGCGR